MRKGLLCPAFLVLLAVSCVGQQAARFASVFLTRVTYRIILPPVCPAECTV
jgi:hypothetical protein